MFCNDDLLRRDEIDINITNQNVNDNMNYNTYQMQNSEKDNDMFVSFNVEYQNMFSIDIIILCYICYFDFTIYFFIIIIVICI